MPQPRALAVALSALLVAPVAVRAAPPKSPFGPEVKTVALRVVDAPDAFGVRPERPDFGSMVAGTLIFGVVIGVAATLGNDNSAEEGEVAEARRLLSKNSAAIDRFAFTTRISADLRRELEGPGWFGIAGEPALVALADPAAQTDPDERELLAQTPAELLEGSGADAVIVVRPHLTLEDRARYLRLRIDLDAYSLKPDGQLRHDYSHRQSGSVSRAVDGTRTPPKTKHGQILEFGDRWLADDAARLRAGYELLFARELPRALSQLRESRFWDQEQSDPRR